MVRTLPIKWARIQGRWGQSFQRGWFLTHHPYTDELFCDSSGFVYSVVHSGLATKLFEEVHKTPTMMASREMKSLLDVLLRNLREFSHKTLVKLDWVTCSFEPISGKQGGTALRPTKSIFRLGQGCLPRTSFLVKEQANQKKLGLCWERRKRDRRYWARGTLVWAKVHEHKRILEKWLGGCLVLHPFLFLWLRHESLWVSSRLSMQAARSTDSCNREFATASGSLHSLLPSLRGSFLWSTLV